MRIDKIKLNNIRSYESSDIQFGDGLILLEGDNGAGKSSLLSTIFSGLYLSDVLKYMNSDINLDSLVKKGEKEGSIKLQFSVNGDVYNVEWVISITEDDGDRKGSTKKCTLSGNSMDDPLEGVRDVGSRISDILGMNSRSFVNSVYVQQGDIMSMVEANEKERKEIIDDLLGLKKLDDFVDRMNIARREFGSQKRTINNLIDEKERQLNEHKQLSDVKKVLNGLKQDIKDKEDNKDQLNDDISDLEDKINEIQSEIDDFSSKKKRYQSLKDKKKSKEKRINELDDKQNKSEKKVEDVKTEIESVKDNIEEKCHKLGIEKSNVDDNIAKVRSDRDNIKDEIREVEKVKIGNKEAEIDRITDNISDLHEEINNIERLKNNNRDKLKELKEQKKEYKSNINKLCGKIEIQFDNLDELRNTKIPDVREDLIDRVADINKELGYEMAKEEIYEEIVKNDSCPVCGSVHNNDIDEHSFDSESIRIKANAIKEQNKYLNEVSEYIENVNDLESDIKIKEKEKENIERNIVDKEESIEQSKDNIQDNRDKIGKKNQKKSEIKSEIETLELELKELKQDKKDYKDKLEKIKTIRSNIQHKNKLDNKKTTLESDIEKYKEFKNKAKKELFELKKELNGIEDDVQDKDINELDDKVDELDDKLRDKIQRRNRIKDDIMDIQSKIAEKEQEESRIKTLEQECSKLQNQKVEAVDRESDAEELMDSYKRVKTTLRKENIGLLNKYSNEVFNSVYTNKVYKKLKIDEQYNIRLITGSDIEIEPKDLSGGEKTILSLSIRAGIYKLLVERNSNSDTLPPFILDEPTTYLDDSHVANIQSVINQITSWNVPQVFVVSHNYNVIQNADESYTIEKKPSTESSVIKQN
jgi:exonuclease SbcC